MRSHLIGAGALALLLGAIVGHSAQAATWDGTSITFNQSNCCGTGPFGTVTGTLVAPNEVDLTVTLNAGFQMINTGFAAVFAFTTDETVSITATSNLFLTGWTGVGDGVIGNPASGDINMDGAGIFGGGTTHAGNGGSDPLGNVLTVKVIGLDGTLVFSDFITNDPNKTNSFFAVDIATGCTGTPSAPVCNSGPPTGVVWTGVPGPVVGAGLPGLVMACGGLLVLGRRRRQKFA